MELVLENTSCFKTCADKMIDNTFKAQDGSIYCTIDDNYKKDYNMFVLISMEPRSIDLISDDMSLYLIEKNRKPFDTGLNDLMI